MSICTGTLYLGILLYIVLSNIVLGMAIHLSKGNVQRILTIMVIFQIILFLDMPLLLPLMSGVCLG